MQSDLLDVLIGVVFVWFLLSVMLSGVNEAFSLVTHIRAKHLWLGIGRLLDPSRSKLPTRFLDATFNLPVRGKFDLRPVTPLGPGRQNRLTSYFADRPQRKADEPTKELRGQTERLYAKLEPQIVETAQPGRLSKITHVASSAVAEAVISLASRVHRHDVLAAAVEMGWTEDEQEHLGRMLSRFDDAARISIDDLLDVAPEAGHPNPSDLRELHAVASEKLTGRDFADALHENPELAEAVRRAVAKLDGAAKVTAAKAAIAEHFDRQMDQVSRFYRRQSRKILAPLAVITVLVFQANSVALALDLWRDSNLRAAVVGGALTASAGQALDEAVAQGRCEVQGTPATTSTSVTTSTPSTTADPVVEAERQLRCAASILQELSSFRVGLGWSDFKDAHETAGSPRAELADVGPYLTDDWGLVGRAITAIALLFGAQFWFDILRRLVGLRKPGAASSA